MDDSIRSDLIDAANFTGEAPTGWIAIALEVSPGKFVEVLLGAFLRDLDHLANDRYVPIGVLRIGNFDRHFSPAVHV